jgi:hypothetical protein
VLHGAAKNRPAGGANDLRQKRQGRPRSLFRADTYPTIVSDLSEVEIITTLGSIGALVAPTEEDLDEEAAAITSFQARVRATVQRRSRTLFEPRR